MKSMLEQLDRLLSVGFDFLELLCKETPSYTGEGKTLAQHLLAFYKNDPRQMLYVVLWATTREVESTMKDDTLFRESNVQTELMFGFFYTSRGIKYLSFLLQPILATVTKASAVLMLNQSTPEYKLFQEALLEQLQFFVDRFITLDKVPLEFQRVFRHMKKQMSLKFTLPNTEFIILSLLFLRVICPALIKPMLIKVEMNIPVMQKALVTCAKVLQNLANGILFEEDSQLSVYNKFLVANTDRIKGFFLSVTKEIPDGGVPEDNLFMRDPAKKKEIDREAALQNILKSLQGNLLETVARESRRFKGAAEFDRLVLVCDSPKWKLFRQRHDTETWTAKLEGKILGIKICGVVRASTKSVYDYIRVHDRAVAVVPNFIKGSIIKIHDENHVDMLVTYKLTFPSFGVREYLFCKHDSFNETYNKGVSICWPLANVPQSLPSLPSQSSGVTSSPQPSAESNTKKGDFNAAGCILQPWPANPQFCWFILITYLDRKLLVSPAEGLDGVLHRALQKVRVDCEHPDNCTPLSKSAETTCFLDEREESGRDWKLD